MVKRDQELTPRQTDWLLAAGIAISLLLIGLAALLLAQLLSVKTGQSEFLTSIFSDQHLWETLAFTLYQAGLSTLLSLALALLLAWALANNPRFPFRGALIALISSALVLPSLVVVLGIISVYGRNGWIASLLPSFLPSFSIYGLSGILLAHVFFNAPFAARVFLHRFETINAEKHKLGYALGLSPWRKFKLIELPACAAALPPLAITIFLLCFTSFAIVLTLGGSPQFNTLEVAIYEAIKFDFDLGRAFQLAMVQIIICLALTLLATIRAPERGLLSAQRASGVLPKLHSRTTKTAQKLIIGVFAIFFLTPLLAIIIDGTGPQLVSVFSNHQFIRAFFTSIAIATASTGFALIFSIAIASAIVSLTAPSRMTVSAITNLFARLLSASAMIYLVFPALVTGLGAFVLYQKLGGNPDIWAAAIITLSNTLIALPFLLAQMRPAIQSGASKYDRLCQSLAMGRWMRLKLVDWPLLRSEITYAGALAFCFSLGDLGVVALFGSDSFKTLPWLLYQNFGSYRTHNASAIALVMLALIFSVFFLAYRASNLNPVARDSR